jgi:hypothetical protein
MTGMLNEITIQMTALTVRTSGCWMSMNYLAKTRAKRTMNLILDHTTEKWMAMRTWVLIVFRIFYNYSAYC